MESKINIKPYVHQFYRGNKLVFAVALLATVLVSLINLVMAWVMQQMFDAALDDSGRYTILELLLMLLGILLAIVAVKGISRFFQSRFIRRGIQQYKDLVFQKLTQKSISAFSRENTAVYLSALSHDISVIENNYVGQIFELMFNGILAIGSLVMMLLYSPMLTAVAIALSLLPIAAAMLTGPRMAAAEQTVSKKNEDFLSLLKDILSGFPVIKCFRAESMMKRQFQKSSNLLEAEKEKKRKVAVDIGILGGTAAVSTQFGTILTGIFLIRMGVPITPGVLIIFADLVAGVIRPIEELPTQLAQRKAAISLIEKLADTLESNTAQEGIACKTVLESAITLDNLSFGYEQDKDILHDVNFVFEVGKSYCLVGSSGSGKSTLLNLLMHAHQNYSGSILYDDTELREIAGDALYDMVLQIQQNVFIFNASIRDNITLFSAFPEDMVSRAMELSGLSALIRERGEAYLCGENGAGLSGGEKQRISIARSLLKKSQVLLLDEATASLDARTAFEVSDAILSLENLTRIVVTHDLEESILRRYDCIITIRNGAIAESGSFEELMDRKGYFYSLYEVSR